MTALYDDRAPDQDSAGPHGTKVLPALRARQVVVHACGLLALAALVGVLYLWAASPVRISRGQAGATLIDARLRTDGIYVFAVRGPFVNGQSFDNYHALSFIGVHLEVGSAAATPTRYLVVSVPHAVLTPVASLPVILWGVFLWRAAIRRRKAAGAGFEVVYATSQGAPAVRRAS